MRTDRPRPTTEQAEARLLADIAAVQADTIDPRSACPEPRRAVGFIEVKPGEEPERFDADWDGGVK